MFGQTDIIGNEIVKIKEQRKIILPLFTQAQLGDELVLLNLQKYLILLNKKDSDTFIKSLIYYYEKSEDFEEKKYYKKLIRVFCAELYEEIKCNKNRQITLPVKLDTDEVLCQGKRKHLEIRPIKKY
jgi:hypothetical protein